MTNSPITPIDPAALAILNTTPALLRELLAGQPEDALTDPRDDGWSVRDALGHIVDAECGIISTRIHRILDEQRPFIRSIDAPARLIEGGYGERTVSSLLDELTERRREHVAWLRTLDATHLAAAGDHDEAGEITVGNIVHQWAYHDLMHIKQIASMLQSGLVDRMGNTRRFYDV